MTAPRTFALSQIVPLRVGAEIEITFIHLPKRSAWDQSILGHEEEVARDEALIRDLETGVVYAAPWHFDGGDINPKLVAAETFRARVLACQVRSGALADGRFRASTWLTLTPANDSAYR